MAGTGGADRGPLGIDGGAGSRADGGRGGFGCCMGPSLRTALTAWRRLVDVHRLGEYPPKRASQLRILVQPQRVAGEQDGGQAGLSFLQPARQLGPVACAQAQVEEGELRVVGRGQLQGLPGVGGFQDSVPLPRQDAAQHLP